MGKEKTPEQRARKAQNRVDRADINTHHVYPKSRFPGMAQDKDNLVKISTFYHDRYHRLFDNMTPEEIAVWLAEYFWGSNDQVIDRVISKLQDFKQSLQYPSRKKGAA